MARRKMVVSESIEHAKRWLLSHGLGGEKQASETQVAWFRMSDPSSPTRS